MSLAKQDLDSPVSSPRLNQWKNEFDNCSLFAALNTTRPQDIAWAKIALAVIDRVFPGALEWTSLKGRFILRRPNQGAGAGPKALAFRVDAENGVGIMGRIHLRTADEVRSSSRPEAIDHIFNSGASAEDEAKLLEQWLRLLPSRVHLALGGLRSPAQAPVSASPCPSVPTETETQMPSAPLNQILYGPPGTGKTYATINTALEILDAKFLAANLNDRKALKDRFDTFERERRVRFVTFHQSFSYEDFVEGIRAGTGDEAEGGSLTYAVERGVFGALCADAARNIEADLRMGVRTDATVWKVSISEANSKDNTRQYCFDHGEARIGWENVGDVLQTNLADPALRLGPKDQASLQNFAHEMQVGDVVLCLGSKTSVRAVGVVAGAYEYEPAVPTGVRADYVHRRAVRWLNTQLDFDITALNGGKQLTLQTVYPLSRIEWPQLEAALRLAGGLPESGTGSQASEKPPYVLVIDEINRGNISRIFGELITLIEPSKRAGAEEALQVLLPYSKKLFSVPKNVYLIGTMNTADRSLTGMDVALRRRFVFKEMPPRPELLDKVIVAGVVPVGQLLRVLNQRIEALLDRDHCLGHANFMQLRETPTIECLAQIFRNQILPLLQEYFFDDWQRIQWVLNDQRKLAELRMVDSTVVDLARLFGRDAEVNVAGGAKTWSINDAAFLETASYLATLGPQAGGADEA